MLQSSAVAKAWRCSATAFHNGGIGIKKEHARASPRGEPEYFMPQNILYANASQERHSLAEFNAHYGSPNKACHATAVKVKEFPNVFLV